MAWPRFRAANLISAGTRAEISVGQVELLNAERTALFFIVVDELILLYAGHRRGR